MTRPLRGIFRQGFMKIASWLEPSIWEGIYSHRSDVPTKGPGFAGPSSFQEGKRALHLLRQDGHRAIPLDVPAEHLLLPFLVSILAHHKEQITVLDLGGGVGLFYQQILNCVIDHPRLDYHILETPFVCSEAAKEWADHSRIHFQSDVAKLPKSVDIVFLNSSLQYLDDYKGQLQGLCQTHRPSYVLLGKLSAGDIPTYASAQLNVDGSVIPYWFINVQEIMQIMSDQRYRLIYKSSLEKNIRKDNFRQPIACEKRRICCLSGRHKP
jgi:putative methyltransferase (TIGR04325 family)